jgi:hypothetical protein
MQMKTIRLVCFLSFFALLATGCSQRSGNMWDDNQTTGNRYKYGDQNSSTVWESKPIWMYNFESKEDGHIENTSLT